MLSDYELRLFHNAAKSLELSDSVRTYLELRSTFSDLDKRREFKNNFSRYYGLLAAGLTEAWRERYFRLFFNFERMKIAEPYQYLLLDLYRLPRRQGDRTLQSSFVSKLVSFHDEARPIYDRRVRDFFGLGPPRVGPNVFKISGFVRNLDAIARRYEVWMQDVRFVEILDQLRDRFSGLTVCHPVRLADFLIHNANVKDR